MPFRRVTLALCAFTAFGAAALAGDPPPNPQCPPRAGFALFTPEVRLMMLADLKTQAEQSAVDIDTLRQMQRDKLRAMSEDQRKAFAADLTKRWNALSVLEQTKLKAEGLKWRAEHPRPEGQGRGPGMGRPDCRPAQ